MVRQNMVVQWHWHVAGRDAHNFLSSRWYRRTLLLPISSIFSSVCSCSSSFSHFFTSSSSQPSLSFCWLASYCYFSPSAFYFAFPLSLSPYSIPLSLSCQAFNNANGAEEAEVQRYEFSSHVRCVAFASASSFAWPPPQPHLGRDEINWDSFLANWQSRWDSWMA